LLKILLKAESDREAQVLAAYLKDVVFAYNPDVQIVAGHNEQFSRWQGILPKPEPIIVASQPDLAEPIVAIPSETNPEVKPATGETEVEKSAETYVEWRPNSSSITLPLLTRFKRNAYDRNYQNKTELVRLNVSITPKTELNSSVLLRITPKLAINESAIFKRTIETLIRDRFGKFQSVLITLDTKQNLHFSSRADIMLPISLQLMASERGITLKEESWVLGRLEGDRIKRNEDFWEKLEYFLDDESHSGLMIIPKSAEPDLVQLIALEKASFFVRNEVCTVENVEDAIQLLGKGDDSNISEASAQFADIQRIIGTRSVGPYAADKQMRNRLKAVLSKNPNHLSAKMILLRGDAARNKRLDRYYIAKKVSLILNGIGWLGAEQVERISSAFLEGKVKQIENFQKEYSNLVGSKDRDLTTYLSNIASTLEVVIRSKKKRKSKTNTKTIKEAMVQFSKQHKDAKKVVDEILRELPQIK